MIPLWQAILLGVVQGITEFLPISSSAHLAIAQWWLPGFEQPGLLFDVALHVGTLVSVLVYFRKDLALLGRDLVAPPWSWKKDSVRLLLLLFAAMVPTGVIGLLGAKFFAATFDSLPWVAWTLIANCGLLLLARRIARGDRGLGQTRISDAVLVGVAQGLAILPGISRSGATIVTGLARGLEPRWSARFSFLLSVPAVGAAFSYEIFSALREGVFTSSQTSGQTSGMIGNYLAGAAVSGVVGCAAIHWLLNAMTRRSLDPYAWYCLAVGVALLLFDLAA